jgi:hypothetical protein
MNKKHYLKLIICLVLLYDQGISQEKGNNFSKELNVCIKAGTTINFVNNSLYKTLNDGSSSNPYKPNNIKYFINPYVSVGIENHFLKHVGLLFNIGFCQTSQQTQPIISSTSTSSSSSIFTYLNNNVFLEILPEFILKKTRLFCGLNTTLSSPTQYDKITFTDLKLNKTSTYYEKDKPNESYHLYSVIGITQGIPIKTSELTITVMYFGLTKKYDSGINLALGVAF